MDLIRYKSARPRTYATHVQLRASVTLCKSDARQMECGSLDSS